MTKSQKNVTSIKETGSMAQSKEQNNTPKTDIKETLIYE
jgi:hypothetical protein